MPTPTKMITPTIHAKLELLNLGGSHKVRAARQMILDAEREGLLRPGSIIIEKTGGNLGIGLAIEANRRGYPLHLVVNLDFSDLKKRILRKYGATLVGVDYMHSGMTTREAVEQVVHDGQRDGIDYVFLDQFANRSNLAAHLSTTGPEVVAYVNQVTTSPGDHVVLVGGIGTGASLTGIASCLKAAFPRAEVVAVQPHGVDFRNGVFGTHRIQGTGVADPPLMDFALVDRWIDCDFAQVCAAQDWLVKAHGILCGYSSGANVHVARQVEAEYAASGRSARLVVLTLIYDGGESYLD